MRGPATAVLVALCGAGIMLFNFPMLIVWDVEGTVFGLPVLPVALFAIWGGLIAALAYVSERAGGARSEGGRKAADSEEDGG